MNEPTYELKMAYAYVGFGSNIDDRLNYIAQALRLLSEADDVSLIQISSLYETEPVGYEEQGWFLNGVVAVETDLPVQQLLALLKEIEKGVGRQHRARWGPREVDLDLLIYDQCCINTPDLTVPHPEMHRRSFVLVPFAEIAPDVLHPIFQQNIRTLLSNLNNEKAVKLAAPPPKIDARI
jgi:2-amino-4-hydroxy-6-hydroxymethyldihydropteridine diphosphokinase